MRSEARRFRRESLKTLTSNRVITIVSFHLEFERRNGNTLFKGCFAFYGYGKYSFDMYVIEIVVDIFENLCKSL